MLQSYSSNWPAQEVPQLQNEFQNKSMLQSSPSLNPAAPGVPRIQNVVSTVDLGCKLDLKYIALKARNAEYNPRRFGAVIMRIRDPKTTALIFASGKLVVTGAKSASSSNLAVRKYARIVAKIGPNKGFELMEKKEKISFENAVQQAVKRSFKVQNLVASCDVGFTIGLEKLQVATSYFTVYDPEIFPGLIFKVTKPKVTMLMFVSGKVVITGAKDFNKDTLKAWELVYPIIVENRKYCHS